MSVAAAVLELVMADVAAAAGYAAAARLPFDATELSEERPVFYVAFSNRMGEMFHAEIKCDHYPKHPPTVEFVSADRKRRGTGDLYPACFHSTPCVCARYNLKAYKAYGGPHDDWRLIDWMLPTGAGVAIRNLREIVSDLHGKIAESEGRLG